MDTRPNEDLIEVFLMSLGFMTVLLLIVFFIVIRQFRFRLRQYQLQLAREVELIDAERKRIHTDLHDELGSGIASISLLAQQVPELLPGSAMEKIYRHTLTLRSKIREIAYNFVPAILETRGLAIALQDYIEDLNANHKVNIHYTLKIRDEAYAPAKTIHVYRIVREILTNALKHAQCSRIDIELTETRKSLLVRISDNGIGLPVQRAETWLAGSGLSHIQSRVNILKAELSIQSNRGTGTTINMNIPLSKLIL